MKKPFFLLLITLVTIFSTHVLAQENISESVQKYVADEVIVKFKPSQINVQKNN